MSCRAFLSLPFLLATTIGVQPAPAQIARHGAAETAPIMKAVTLPAETEMLLLSGEVPSPIDASAPANSREAFGDTEAQTVSVFRKIEKTLAQRGYGMGDVVKLTVFLVGDPALGGKMDFAGFSRGYARFFGTIEQPNKVARSTVQVSALVNPVFLVEIEATAAKAK